MTTTGGGEPSAQSAAQPQSAEPYLDMLPEPERSCALAGLDEGLRKLGEQPWYEYNRSRERARQILRPHPVAACPAPAPSDPRGADEERVPQEENRQEPAPPPEQQVPSLQQGQAPQPRQGPPPVSPLR